MRNLLSRLMSLMGVVVVCGTILFVLSTPARAVEPLEASTIRKNLSARVGDLGSIDEIRKTPWTGLYEVRSGTDLFYTDHRGDFLIQGSLIDTRRGPDHVRNLTQERVQALTKIDFQHLPFKDALMIRRGHGERIFAIFEDPNCGYCKQLERNLSKLDNVTVYVFLYPVLGQDSQDKSRRIWCAPQKASAWQDWMLKGELPEDHDASWHCDTDALSRNLALGKQNKVEGVPTLIFRDGSRVSAALSAAELEQKLKLLNSNSAK
jgi:thiol:disulfide interchange protein DsbC